MLRYSNLFLILSPCFSQDLLEVRNEMLLAAVVKIIGNRCPILLVDLADLFGIIDRKYTPKAMQPGTGGAILLWHVDDLEAAFEQLKTMGAKEYDPITKRGDSGFVTASVIDPFGNILGIMYNPHFVEVLSSQRDKLG
jgi:hypothetical protein